MKWKKPLALSRMNCLQTIYKNSVHAPQGAHPLRYEDQAVTDV